MSLCLSAPSPVAADDPLTDPMREPLFARLRRFLLSLAMSDPTAERPRVHETSKAGAQPQAPRSEVNALLL